MQSLFAKLTSRQALIAILAILAAIVALELSGVSIVSGLLDLAGSNQTGGTE